MDYRKIYKKIEKRYIILILLLVVFFASGQIIIQNQIDHGKDMANVINLSGRQRMLSQKISKNTLMIYKNQDPISLTYYIKDLEESLEIFDKTHQDLINGDQAIGLGIEKSDTTIMMFNEIDPYFKTIMASGKQIINLARQELVNDDQILGEVKIINENEKVFLEKMDGIVFQYNAEAENDILRLEQIVRFVFYLIILGIIIITLVILMPATKTLRQAFVDINESNENIKKIFQIMKGALFLIDEDGNIITQNTDAEKMMLQNKNNHIEKAIKWLDITIGDYIKKLKAGEELGKIEAKIEANNGEILTVVITGICGKYEQKDVMLISAYDITDQKKAEELLRNAAATDELTGLYNRHFLEGIIGGEIQASKRYQYPLSAAILDIDDFKMINDTWGHPVGDLVLKEIAMLLIENTRMSDYVLRIGGEEFVILMPHVDLAGAYQVAEKIRQLIEANIHPIAGKYTVSFGVAERRSEEDYPGLYNRIDGALYQAKAQGKNRVILSTSKEEDNYSLKWKKSWECGEKNIDRQHQDLVALIDKIKEDQVKDPQTLIPNLERLIKETKDHFDYEESVLEEINYSHYRDHQKIHQELLEKAEDFKERALNKEIHAEEVLDFIFHDLVIGHILREDTKFFGQIEKRTLVKNLTDSQIYPRED